MGTPGTEPLSMVVKGIVGPVLRSRLDLTRGRGVGYAEVQDG